MPSKDFLSPRMIFPRQNAISLGHPEGGQPLVICLDFWVLTFQGSDQEEFYINLLASMHLAFWCGHTSTDQAPAQAHPWRGWAGWEGHRLHPHCQRAQLE